MPWHDISDGGVLALVHQEDGRHLHSAPHRSPDWASERWWLREDGFEFPGARQLGNRPIRPRAAPTSKVRKTLDTTQERSGPRRRQAPRGPRAVLAPARPLAGMGEEKVLALDYQVLWAFTLLWLAIVPTPGANSLLIVHLALTRGWREVAIALIGNLIGIAGYALATLLGLALLLAKAPSVRLIIYVLGGAYLVWVGARLLFRGLNGTGATGAAPAAVSVASAAGTFAQGILTALANVQALFFLASIFAGVGISRPTSRPALPRSGSSSSATAAISCCWLG